MMRVEGATQRMKTGWHCADGAATSAGLRVTSGLRANEKEELATKKYREEHLSCKGDN